MTHSFLNRNSSTHNSVGTGLNPKEHGLKILSEGDVGQAPANTAADDESAAAMPAAAVEPDAVEAAAAQAHPVRLVRVQCQQSH